MLEVIKKSLGIFDWLILVAAVYMFNKFNYADLEISEIVYIIVFSLWFVMLIIRVSIVYKSSGGKK